MSEPDRRPIAILVVDRDRIIRMVTTDLLEDAGFRAIEAHDAHEALDLLERHQDVRLLIAGHTLPGQMDGIRLAHLVHNRWPTIRIIVTSGGMSRTEDELPLGARLIRKPYQFEDLLREMESLLGQNDEPDQGAPVLPEVIGLQTPLSAASGGAHISGPTPEPDNT
ncbi:CheY-like chemotaxis protein [Methylobacterium sp. BE186]|uniref:response regulator n=1 Tax=Methylobacterium sp. BE186 TaxID=2817715 RepID=UPI002866341F|nr:response regulator [Methylobacterium sp. BE186]MDR7038819.1 CheY-like chemotaxis protein [Methylobacterium sp. BE186]